MRLAFEAALAKTGADITALVNARPEQSLPAWSGPRDR